MTKLKCCDKEGVIRFTDLASADFAEQYPYIDAKYANQIQHGETDSGELLTGLGVTYLAWALVGKKHYVVPT